VSIHSIRVMCRSGTPAWPRARSSRDVAKLSGRPSARAAVVHHERFEAVDIGIKIGVERLGRRPIHGRLLARYCARFAVRELRRLDGRIKCVCEAFGVVHKPRISRAIALFPSISG
jgi:hypothetical protein